MLMAELAEYKAASIKGAALGLTASIIAEQGDFRAHHDTLRARDSQAQADSALTDLAGMAESLGLELDRAAGGGGLELRPRPTP